MAIMSFVRVPVPRKRDHGDARRAGASGKQAVPALVRCGDNFPHCVIIELAVQPTAFPEPRQPPLELAQERESSERLLDRSSGQKLSAAERDPLSSARGAPGTAAYSARETGQPLANSSAASSPARASRPPATIASFDADEHPVFDSDPARPPARAARRRGRPRGSSTRLLAGGEGGNRSSGLGAGDVALLRAWLMGVPLARAGRSYLADGNTSSAARGAHLQRLFAQLRAAALQLPNAPQAVALVEELLQPQQTPAPASVDRPPASAVVASPPPVNASAAPPTLEEFAQRFDADMYSERELLELYEQEFPVAQEDAGDDAVHHSAHSQAAREPSTAGTPALPQSALARKLAILDALAPQLAGAEVQPTPQAPLQAWLAAPLATRLRERLEVQTLGQLVAAVNAGGRWWHRQIPGLGRLRAARLVLWLARGASTIGVPIEAGLLKAATARAGERVPRHGEAARGGTGQGRASDAAAMTTRRLFDADSTPAPADALPQQRVVARLAPLAQFAWPPQLLGVDGTFRRPGSNTLGARDDREAVALWLALHLEGKSGATDRVYRRAVERLVLWALCERRRALSSLNTADFLAFKAFLCQPPAHWCGSERVVRASPDWRPLRGPLSMTAVAQVIGVVQQMYAGWRTAGYVAVDTAAAVLPQAQAPSASPAQGGACGMDVSRAFSAQELEAMRQALAQMVDGPARRRLRAILLLLLSTGLRRSELQGLTFGMLRPAGASGTGALGDCRLQVCGKGGRLREVIVPAAVVQALQAHYADRRALAAAGVLAPQLISMSQSEAPLLGVLRQVRASGRAGMGDSTAAAARAPSLNGALAGATVYTIVKNFFVQVARSQPGQGRAAFERASTHWLRHSFAHAALVGEKQRVPLVQAMLGHANLRTTRLYVKAGVHELAPAAPWHAAL